MAEERADGETGLGRPVRAVGNSYLASLGKPETVNGARWLVMIGPVHALAGYLVAYAALTRLRSNGPRDGVLATMLGVAPDIDYASRRFHY